MKDISVLYFHNLDFTFKSAQTIQVVKDYFYLSKLGIKVKIYGTYKNQEDFILVQSYLKDSAVKIVAKKNSSYNKILLKINFLYDLLTEQHKKIVVTRHYRKLISAIRLKQFGIKFSLIHEMHEESFPYLFKASVSKAYTKHVFSHKKLNLLIFTNYSQLTFFKTEFGFSPKSYTVLPNGVETEKFVNVKMEFNYVITYGGGFNKWKNVDLIFEAFSLLEDKYTLRIAGGKGDIQSDDYINFLTLKFNIDPKRIDYLGFVNNQDFPSKVLDKSNLLLLPLGDNIQSRYLTSPMKLFEYMSTQIPVLAVNFPSVSLIANNTIHLSPNDANEFSKKIIEACESSKNHDILIKMNKIAEKFSYSNRSLKLHKVINNAI